MRFSALLGLTILSACSADSSDSRALQLPPNGGLHQERHIPAGVLSVFGGSGGGTFVAAGATAPGTATYVNAPAIDPTTMSQPQPGTGSFSIAVDGTSYASNDLQTATLTFSDPSVGDFVALDGFTSYTGTDGQEWINEVVALVPRSDFAIGVPIALDGNTRIAFFGAGHATDDQPSVMAAAVTGTVTFTAGSLTGVVSGTLSGDFGSINVTPTPPQGSTNALVAGNYNLTVSGPADVYCDGTLAGHESSFAGITAASLGLGNGAVALALSAGVPSITGAPGFAGSLQLDDQGQGLYAGFTNDSATGPDSTTLVGKYLVIDGGGATATLVNGGVGAGYMTADQQGTCSVSFGAQLATP
jgi:hypothetical protein